MSLSGLNYTFSSIKICNQNAYGRPGHPQRGARQLDWPYHVFSIRLVFYFISHFFSWVLIKGQNSNRWERYLVNLARNLPEWSDAGIPYLKNWILTPSPIILWPCRGATVLCCWSQSTPKNSGAHLNPILYSVYFYCQILHFRATKPRARDRNSLPALVQMHRKKKETEKWNNGVSWRARKLITFPRLPWTQIVSFAVVSHPFSRELKKFYYFQS